MAALGAKTFTTANITSVILSLSKKARRLGSTLSRLFHGDGEVDATAKYMTEEVESLGVKCELVYAQLETVMSKNGPDSSLPSGFDDRMWICLGMQVDETGRTIQELDMFVERTRSERYGMGHQGQQQTQLNEVRNQIASIRMSVYACTNNLHTLLQILITIGTQLVPDQIEQQLCKELQTLQDIIETRHRSLKADPRSLSSPVEVDIIQCAREVVAKGTAIYEASLSPRPSAGNQKAEYNDVRVAGWIDALDSMRRSRHLKPPEARNVTLDTASTQLSLRHGEVSEVSTDESDDDLETDLAKAALNTGKKAFESQDWVEADSLLQEGLRVLGQLPLQQRTFCDIFSLHYQLAVCTYHTKEPTDAEMALVSLIQQSASSDEQRGYIYDASHLLSLLYTRTGQIQRARMECEKTLQARRRLLGKRSDVSLESTALMAHIYVLLNNRALAKSCLAMIPEKRRDAIIKAVEDSLGGEVEHLDFLSPVTRSTSDNPSQAVISNNSQSHASPLGVVVEDSSYHSPSSVATLPSSMVASPAPSIHHSHQHNPSNTVTSSPPPISITQSGAIGDERFNREYSSNAIAFDTASLSIRDPPEVNGGFQGKNLSRKEILDKIGCQPKDRIEEAVCSGDEATLASLLDKRKDFWKSKLRKRVRPERLTALHFAALFGEIDMARRLIGSNFNVNDVPYGYTTSLSPLKIAIGARKVNMVEFLIANGAKPAESDTWSSLAGQLLSRSWLSKTLSESEREFAPNWIVSILNILLRHGWEVNEPLDSSGGTVLHQAVAFWTGSYRWDLNLRASITTFLCERGANPLQANKEGKTPYDVALASGHQDLLAILNRDAKRSELGVVSVPPVELSS